MNDENPDRVWLTALALIFLGSVMVGVGIMLIILSLTSIFC